MITLSEYLMGRDKTHKDELTDEILTNAQDLIQRVNLLTSRLNLGAIEVSSGWRPKAVNQAAKGAKSSLHLTGRAVDIRDPRGRLGYHLIQEHARLREHGLWLEFPRFTPGWVHLDTGYRMERTIRTFLP